MLSMESCPNMDELNAFTGKRTALKKTIRYNMDDVNKRKFVHAQNIVCSTMDKE